MDTAERRAVVEMDFDPGRGRIVEFEGRRYKMFADVFYSFGRKQRATVVLHPVAVNENETPFPYISLVAWGWPTLRAGVR